jgi:hypothetical protein
VFLAKMNLPAMMPTISAAIPIIKDMTLMSMKILFNVFQNEVI